jgi:hypothetical protein
LVRVCGQICVQKKQQQEHQTAAGIMKSKGLQTGRDLLILNQSDGFGCPQPIVNNRARAASGLCCQ